MTTKPLKQMRYGLLLAFITLIYGFGLGGVFGAFEHEFKDYLESQAKGVLEEKYEGNIDKTEAVLSKSWTYIKRAHLHANGLGTASLAMMLFLTLCPLSEKLLLFTSLSLGLGSLGYALFWLLAGILAPSLGSTGAAKEALTFLAFPSSGLCFIGLLLTTFACIKHLFSKIFV